MEKSIFLLILMLLFGIACNKEIQDNHDFEEILLNETFVVNDINYQVISLNPYEAMIIENGSNYEGEIIIPEIVLYKNENLIVKKINSGSFENCIGLKSIELPNSIDTINNFAFIDCSSMQEIKLPQYLRFIGSAAFCRASSLVSIEIPDSVEKGIDHSTFIHCSSIKSVKIGNSVEWIADLAFGYCSNLETITLGESINYIADKAFEDCSSLKRITSKAIDPPELGGSNAFGTPLKSTLVYVPKESIDRYKSAEFWSFFENILPISE